MDGVLAYFMNRAPEWTSIVILVIIVVYLYVRLLGMEDQIEEKEGILGKILENFKEDLKTDLATERGTFSSFSKEFSDFRLHLAQTSASRKDLSDLESKLGYQLDQKIQIISADLALIKNWLIKGSAD